MGSYQLITSTYEHLDKLEINPVHEGEQDKETLKRVISLDHVCAYTLVYHDDPIAILGAGLKHKGVGAGFAMMGTSIDKHKVALCRATRFLVYVIAEKLGLKRLECVVRADSAKAKKFAEYLTFEVEGLMKSYGPTGLDYYLLARVF